MRILIADDDANTFRLVSFRLTQLGHTLLWAQHGAQTLDLARTQAPDLIILDVLMPVLNGFQVLNELKADPATKDIPVVMLTALGSARDVLAGLEHGAQAYIVKPFEFADLIGEVDRVSLSHLQRRR